MTEVPGCRFGDVHGQVADTFEVAVDLHGGDDGTEVGRHRLVERQQSEAAVVHVDMQAVDRLVAGQHGVEQPRVACDEPFDGRAHPLLGESAHLEEATLQRLELFLKMTYRLFH